LLKRKLTKQRGNQHTSNLNKKLLPLPDFWHYFVFKNSKTDGLWKTEKNKVQTGEKEK
jgi:hypothetical protein